MNDTSKPRKIALWAGATGLLATGALAGAVLAGGAAANATPSTTAAVSNASTTPGEAGTSFPGHGTAAHESQEKAVTGTNAAKARAAAVKSVGSGTAGTVTTDFRGTGYEVTVTKSDASTVEVHLDQSFTVVTPGQFRG